MSTVSTPDVTSSRVGLLLDALPDPAVLLDHDGVIVADNTAWRRFAADADAFTAGSPWLPRFLAIAPAAAAGRDALAEGLRAVADGERPRWDLDYFYSAGGEDRCLALTVSPLRVDGLGGLL